MPRHRRVSIHAFRGEGDHLTHFGVDGFVGFQSTPSGGKATKPVRQHRIRRSVSIHAFRGEGDGADRAVALAFFAFQSTPSGGKATAAYCHNTVYKVSIHAFRGEGDI